MSGDAGRAQDVDAQFQAVYARLHALAHQQRRRIDGATLDTTGLVHEVYLEFRDRPEALEPRDFFAYAARAMRHLLLDRARRRGRARHGGDLRQVELGPGLEANAAGDAWAGRLIELDQALATLRDQQPRAAEVVELHFFAGLAFADIARLLARDRRTIHRDWRFARAWLLAALD
ncbi:MAG: sigma-70 family RNA polymerase sigma factor [Xanthomonadales bacterium]|nr:sigma-70 family RNA polymerase sigma factor [Xanthomonadales bacterium]